MTNLIHLSFRKPATDVPRKNTGFREPTVAHAPQRRGFLKVISHTFPVQIASAWSKLRRN